MNEVTFNCPHCGQSLEVDKNMGGMKVECPACNRPLKVPGAKLRFSQPSDRWTEQSIPSEAPAQSAWHKWKKRVAEIDPDVKWSILKLAVFIVVLLFAIAFLCLRLVKKKPLPTPPDVTLTPMVDESFHEILARAQGVQLQLTSRMFGNDNHVEGLEYNDVRKLVELALNAAGLDVVESNSQVTVEFVFQASAVGAKYANSHESGTGTTYYAGLSGAAITRIKIRGFEPVTVQKSIVFNPPSAISYEETAKRRNTAYREICCSVFEDLFKADHARIQPVFSRNYPSPPESAFPDYAREAISAVEARARDLKANPPRELEGSRVKHDAPIPPERDRSHVSVPL